MYLEKNPFGNEGLYVGLGRRTVGGLITKLRDRGKQKDLRGGKLLHTVVVEAGYDNHPHIASALITMYSKCGSMQDAHDVFESMVHRNVVSWTALILGYVENGESLMALDMFNTMDCAPNGFTFVAAFKACANLTTQKRFNKESCLQKGVSIHIQAREHGLDRDLYVGSALVDMYSKCGDMLCARDVFDGMTHRDGVCWNGLILGYVENAESLMALDVFNRMECAPNSVTFVAALKACAALGNENKLAKPACLQKGVSIHMQARECGFEKDVFVASTLVDMYSKCGDIRQAQNVFDGMMHRTVVTWTALILGYVENGKHLTALDVFNSMDCAPNCLTFIAALKACAGLVTEDNKTCIQKAVTIHRRAKEFGFDKDVYLTNTLLDMYSKLGDMLCAREVFDGMMHKSVVSWNILILGYVENGESSEALNVFNSMDCAPDGATCVAALRACADGSKLDSGLSIHGQAKELGFDKHIVVANTLIDMYSKCRSMLHAQEIFDEMVHRNVVSWNVLILGYVENGESLVALDVFNSMDCAPEGATFVAVLKACAALANEFKETSLHKGVAVHRQAREYGLDKDVFVANTLLDMYSKCGAMVQARDAFDGMVLRDVVSWNILILGYVENGESSMALEVFNSMDCAPNGATFVAALKACASLAVQEAGQRIHARIRELGWEQDELVGSCLVDFYGKCGNMAAAEEVFNRMCSKDIVSWNALLGGYSLLGNVSKVFSSVKRMQETRLQMDDVTVLLILRACSHAGMVEEGEECFQSMSKYGVNPTMEHYTCMVDILCRANRLQEALLLVRHMPFEGNSRIWMSLLGSCKKWSDVEVAKVAFFALENQNNKEYVAAAYVLMRNFYERV